MPNQENLARAASHDVVARVDSLTGQWRSGPSLDGQPVSAGTELLLDSKLTTNEAYVQVSSEDGTVWRLGPQSNLVVQDSDGRRATVVWGEAYLFDPQGRPKYRTSCYVGAAPTYIMNVAPNVDRFYALDNDVEISEYDEYGEQFTIVVIPAGHMADLTFLEGRTMRQRYHAGAATKIAPDERNRIRRTFETNWA